MTEQNFPLDPRLHPYRADLAAAHLQDRVQAPRFVAGEALQVVQGIADLRARPDPAAPLDSQLLFGERVTCYERAKGWAWVQNQADGYVGYLPESALGPETPPANHRLSALRSFLYPEPDPKAPPLDGLSLGARVTVEQEGEKYCRIAGSGWLHRHHLAPLDQPAADWLATARGFLGLPYLWGGRSSSGLDCSALVQLALAQAGIVCPRDSDLQAAALGEARPLEAPPARGDLIFSPGHAAIALGDGQVLHATSHQMLVVIEPLAELVRRIEQIDKVQVTAIRRL